MSDDEVREIFGRAAELAPEEQAAFLAEACGGDTALRQEVEALLTADTDAAHETFWQHSAVRHQALADDDAGAAIGETIGHYRLAELIGKGGMGAVYRGERSDAEYEKNVAIKLIHGFFHSADVITHFRVERQILANLEHPNIARLLDGGTRADGSPYLIMEYIEGISPYDFCRDHQLSTGQRLELFRRICSAVHFAHQHMVIHRDLKPANILVTAEGTPKLLDFGIAKITSPESLGSNKALTEPGMLRLTARYASPEQVRGESVTTATDVYSLGVILYELLTGHSPYGDADLPTHKIMSAVCDEEPIRPSTWVPKLKGDLDNIILRALRKAPLERYASADQFSDDVLRYLEGRPVQARGDAALYVAAKFVRRNWVAVTGAAVLLCSLVGGLIDVSLSRARADRRFNDVRRLAHAVMFDYADAIDRLPGATPVRERMVKDALTYQDNLAKEADTPELRREVVDGYVRVSTVQGNEYSNNLGDTAGALASAQKAVTGADALLRRDHTLPTLDSAASAYSTDGSLLYSAGDLPGADRAYQQAVSLRKEIAQRKPEDVTNRIELATCLSHLGDLYGGYGYPNLGKTIESLAFYEQGKVISRELTEQHPNNVEVAKEHYETLISLSSAENVMGRHIEAFRDLEDAVVSIEKVLAIEPHDTNVTFELANAEARLGQMRIDAREGEDATPHVTRSLALLQGMHDADPTNALFRRALAIVENELAAALRSAGHAAAGLPHNQTALRLVQGLTQDSPKSAQYRMDLGTTERNLSEGLLATGDAAAALRHADQATLILCKDDVAASDATTALNCGRAWLTTGTVSLALHETKAATAALQKAVAIGSALSEKDPRNVTLRSNAARAEAAYATALAGSGDVPAALAMDETALRNWTMLRESRSITGEDLHRSEEALVAVAGFKVRR